VGKVNASEKPQIERVQIVYGEIVYWVTIVAAIICMIGPVISMANVENNVLNPHYLFSGIFEGKSAEAIWKEAGSGFPGGHFYLGNFTKGDGFTQFGLALGCSVGLWALLAAAYTYIGAKGYLDKCLSLCAGALILFTVFAYQSYLEACLGLWAILLVSLLVLACYKEKKYLYASLSLWVSLLIFLSMVGVVKGH